MKPLLPFTLLLTAAAWAVTKSDATRVYVNGLPLRQPALVKDGVTYVPLRAVSEALGCAVDYDSKSARVFIWGGQTVPQDPNAALRNPQGAAGPGLPMPGLPRDPRPVLPQPPMPGRP